MKLVFVIFFLFISRNCYCQNWNSLANGTSNFVRVIYSDTINNSLLIGGMFSNAGDSIVHQIASWDGNAFDNIGVGTGDTNCSGGCGAVLSIVNFDNKLFMSGSFDVINGIHWQERFLAYFDGTNWIPSGNPDVSVNLDIVNNEMFALNILSEIDSMACKDVAIYTGNGWEPFFTIGPMNDDQIWCMDFYDGNYVMAGNFNVGGGKNEIVLFDGLQTYPLQNGLLGGIAAINDLEVYKGILWVGGYFLASDGNVSDFIAAWDGQNWFNPLPDVYYINQVYDLEVIYVAEYIGVQDDTCLIIPLSATYKKFESNLSIFPNPTSSLLQLHFSTSQNLYDEIEIFNLLGEKVFSQSISILNGENDFEVNCVSLPSGIYILELKNSNLQKKFVVNR